MMPRSASSAAAASPSASRPRAQKKSTWMAELGQHGGGDDRPATGMGERALAGGDPAARRERGHLDELDPLDVADDRDPGWHGPQAIAPSRPAHRAADRSGGARCGRRSRADRSPPSLGAGRRAAGTRRIWPGRNGSTPRRTYSAPAATIARRTAAGGKAAKPYWRRITSGRSATVMKLTVSSRGRASCGTGGSSTISRARRRAQSPTTSSPPASIPAPYASSSSRVEACLSRATRTAAPRSGSPSQSAARSRSESRPT